MEYKYATVLYDTNEEEAVYCSDEDLSVPYQLFLSLKENLCTGTRLVFKRIVYNNNKYVRTEVDEVAAG